MFDLLIKNGMILDGTGEKRFLGDVAVTGGRIVEVAPHIEGEAKRIIDAEGLFVTPGFIDTHDHSDEIVLIPRPGLNKLEQGITFVLMGQCGDSPAPYTPGNLPALEKSLPAEELAKLLKSEGKPVTVGGEIADGIEIALRHAEEHNGAVCCVGSLYQAGEVLEYFQKREEA